MEYIRTYALVAEINNVHVSSIELRDTAGSLLDCNYVKVDTSANPAGGGASRLNRFRVNFDNQNLTTPLENQTVVSGDLGSTSGSTGQYILVNESCEFFFSDANRVNTIKVDQFNDTNTLFLVTYGQMKSQGPRRQNLRSIGS